MTIRVALGTNWTDFPSQLIVEYDTWEACNKNHDRDIDIARRIAKDQGRLKGSICELVVNVSNSDSGINDAISVFEI